MSADLVQSIKGFISKKTQPKAVQDGNLLEVIKQIEDYDFEYNLWHYFKDGDLVEMLRNKEIYSYLCENVTKVEKLLEFSSKKPALLLNNVSVDFWLEYSKCAKYSSKSIALIVESKVGDKIFSDKVVAELLGNHEFRKNLFRQLKRETCEKFVIEHIENFNNENSKEILEDILPYFYSMKGPINSKSDNDIFVKTNSVEIKGLVASKPDKNAKNSVSLSGYFKDPQIRKEILNNYAILSGLSREDRTQLYSKIPMAELTKEEVMNIKKLLFNGYLTDFPKELFANPMFCEILVNETSMIPFRKIINTLKETNSDVVAELLRAKDNNIGEMLFMNNQIKHKQYPTVTYSNGEKDNFLEVFMYRYFRTCSHDMFITAKLISNAMRSLNKTGQHISKEGIDLINAFITIINSRTREELQYFALKDSVEDAKLLLKLKQAAEAYINKHGEINLEKVVEVCKNSFGENLQESLTQKTSNGVVQREIDGQKVYDLTECEDLHLLIHSTRKVVLPSIEDKNESLISMSLLDNNHLTAFIDDGFILGFDSVTEDMVVHALTCDSGSGYNVSAQSLLNQRLSIAAPIYTDIESFMNATAAYNEIKIKPKANAHNNNGEAIMKPSYLLYKSNDLTHIPQHILDKANELGVDVYVLNTDLCKQKEYEAIIPHDDLYVELYDEEVTC